MWSGRKTFMTHSGNAYWLKLAERTLALEERPTSGARARMSAACPALLVSAPATSLLHEPADSLEHMLVPLAVATAMATVSARFTDAFATAHEPFAAGRVPPAPETQTELKPEPEREVSVL